MHGSRWVLVPKCCISQYGIICKCLINFEDECSVLPCFPETRQHWVVNFNHYIMEYDKPWEVSFIVW